MTIRLFGIVFLAFSLVWIALWNIGAWRVFLSVRKQWKKSQCTLGEAQLRSCGNGMHGVTIFVTHDALREAVTMNSEKLCPFETEAAAQEKLDSLEKGEKKTCYVDPNNDGNVWDEDKTASSSTRRGALILSLGFSIAGTFVGLFFVGTGLRLTFRDQSFGGTGFLSLCDFLWETQGQRTRAMQDNVSPSDMPSPVARISTGDDRRREVVDAFLEKHIVDVADVVKDGEDQVCVVCLDEISTVPDSSSDVAGQRVCQTACHHVFHKTCIGRWLSQNTVCPVCNRCLYAEV